MDKASEARLVHRLCRTILIQTAVGAALTLAAQPPSYWTNPQTAIRFDGLPINSATNPMFDFLLGRGWLAYLVCVILFGTAVWLITKAFPKKPAIVAEFAILLGLCYSGSTWLAVRWHMGVGGTTLYVTALAITLAIVLGPVLDDREMSRLKRLRWVMALAIAVDAVCTLLGQPANYWHNTATVYEGNPASKFFLEEGWWAYAAYNLVEIGAPWLLAVRVAPVTGWAIAFGMMLGGFCGGSNWLFFVWRLGLQAPLIY
ncbi:MAG: hypothetical protein ACRD3S_21680, partial [Terracidiphilus sp.]